MSFIKLEIKMNVFTSRGRVLDGYYDYCSPSGSEKGEMSDKILIVSFHIFL